MSQNDFTIANQTAPAFRADLNNALQALASLSSGSSQPATTFANMLWYDTGTNILKMRTEADDAWMNIGYLDQTANTFRILDDTQVVNTSGTQTGLLGDQSTATWETGTGTTESLVSPAKIKAAILANQVATIDVKDVDAFLAGPFSNSFGQYSYGGTTVLGTVTNLDGCSFLWSSGTVTCTNPGTSTLRVDRSTNNGSTWGDSITVATVTDETSADGTLTVKDSARIPMYGYNAARLVHFSSLSIFAASSTSNAILAAGSF